MFHILDDTSIINMSNMSFSKHVSYEKITEKFNNTGCSRPNCPFGPTFNRNKCALNLHDTIIRVGYHMGTVDGE